MLLVAITTTGELSTYIMLLLFTILMRRIITALIRIKVAIFRALITASDDDT